MELSLEKHYEEFTDSLLHAYNSQGELEMFAQFDLGVDLDHIVAPGGLRKQVFDLIKWAESRGRVDELFAAALKRRPNNPKLKQLAGELAAEAIAGHEALAEKVAPLAGGELESDTADAVRDILGDYTTKGGLEALVVSVPHLETGEAVGDWRGRMRRAERRICSIGGKRFGTGFLVGNDRIITNSHVVKSGDSRDDFDVVFDFVEGTNRSDLKKYQLVEEFARSEPREFDYAVFRLDSVPDGDRGFFKVKPYRFEQVREPISVLGHPNGGPLSFSFGVLFDQDSFMGRIAYTANTAGGSSGSPVFLEDWDLVAIHHHGEKNINNHGIPMRSILKHLKGAGHEGLLTPT